jgi:hypothetical protein
MMRRTEVVEYLDRISVLLERVLVRACGLGLVMQEELQRVQEDSRRIA